MVITRVGPKVANFKSWFWRYCTARINRRLAIWPITTWIPVIWTHTVKYTTNSFPVAHISILRLWGANHWHVGPKVPFQKKQKKKKNKPFFQKPIQLVKMPKIPVQTHFPLCSHVVFANCTHREVWKGRAPWDVCKLQFPHFPHLTKLIWGRPEQNTALRMAGNERFFQKKRWISIRVSRDMPPTPPNPPPNPPITQLLDHLNYSLPCMHDAPRLTRQNGATRRQGWKYEQYSIYTSRWAPFFWGP